MKETSKEIKVMYINYKKEFLIQHEKEITQKIIEELDIGLKQINVSLDINVVSINPMELYVLLRNNDNGKLYGSGLKFEYEIKVDK